MTNIKYILVAIIAISFNPVKAQENNKTAYAHHFDIFDENSTVRKECGTKSADGNFLKDQKCQEISKFIFCAQKNNSELPARGYCSKYRELINTLTAVERLESELNLSPEEAVEVLQTIISLDEARIAKKEIAEQEKTNN